MGIRMDPRLTRRAGWLLFAAFAACAPDLDFLPGLLEGDLNRFHQKQGHSLGAAVIFGVLSYLFVRIWSRRWSLWAGIFGFLFFASHLLVDFFTADYRAPYGQMLFWPLSEQYFISPVAIFEGIKHGKPGDTTTAFLADLLSTANLMTIGLEVLILGPFTILALWCNRKAGHVSEN